MCDKTLYFGGTNELCALCAIICSDTMSMVQIELMLDAAALVSCDWLELIKSPPPWKLVEMSGRNVSTGPQL